MIVGLSKGFPEDAIERALPDVAGAHKLLSARRPDIIALLKRRRAIYHDVYGDPAHDYLERAERALQLALARFGLRHGTLGSDFHDYHNEDHALEILDRRLGRVLNQVGVDALPGRDWLALSMFAACHDLRQREGQVYKHSIGNNEAASIAETHRILDVAGFDRVKDRETYVALEIMIAGSTFDASPRPPGENPAESAATGGPLAPKLAPQLEQAGVNWKNDPELERALKLALIASDLDTANVAERFPDFAASGTRLASEREMRLGRSLNDVASGAPVLSFLTDGQERYFFELHRFCSDLGLKVFGPGKENNAARVRQHSNQLRVRFGTRAGQFNGAEVVETHMRLAESA